LAAAPGSPLAHYAKGEVLRVQNRCDEAIFEFETVLAFNQQRHRRIISSCTIAN
jgi:hypothetical protein